MARKLRALSQPALRAEKKGRSTVVKMTLDQAKAHLSKQGKPAEQADDSKIDFSEIPELSDSQLKKMKRIGPGRPLLGTSLRKMISIKLDPKLLEDLKREAKKSGKPYQSLIHEILQKHMKSRAA
jgi:uncharacterized protein (DUF4415 family)